MTEFIHNAVSFLGGFVSSASAVASAAALAASGTLPARVAGFGAILASLTSALVSLPLVMRFAGDRTLRRRMTLRLVGIVLVGVLGAIAQVAVGETMMVDGLRRLTALVDVVQR
jgi:uncharacterized membrane protein (DUF4010 family)